MIDLVDPGCLIAALNKETPNPTPLPGCADSEDNDNDKKIDLADPGCLMASDSTETPDPSTLPECSDNEDNDIDSKADYPNDEGCYAASDQSENTENVAAGPDSDQDGLPDEWEREYFKSLDQGPDDNPDEDGLTNVEEYSYNIASNWDLEVKGVYWHGTDPTSPDTDGDDYNDDVEIDKSTDPKDSKDYPRSKALPMITLLLGLLLVLGGGGYIVYDRYLGGAKKPAPAYRPSAPTPRPGPIQRTKPKPITGTLKKKTPVHIHKQKVMPQIVKQRIKSKEKERKKFFDVFSKAELLKKPVKKADTFDKLSVLSHKPKEFKKVSKVVKSDKFKSMPKEKQENYLSKLSDLVTHNHVKEKNVFDKLSEYSVTKKDKDVFSRLREATKKEDRKDIFKKLAKTIKKSKQ